MDNEKRRQELMEALENADDPFLEQAAYSIPYREIVYHMIADHLELLEDDEGLSIIELVHDHDTLKAVGDRIEDKAVNWEADTLNEIIGDHFNSVRNTLICLLNGR